MNPSSPRPEPDATTPAEDELVSSVLDGEATEREQATVEGDARLRARLEAFATLQARAAHVERPDRAARDAAVERALAAVAPEPDRAPSDLADRRLERERRRRRLATALAAAAVLLVLVPLLAVTWLDRGQETDVASSGPAEEATEDAAPSLAQGSADEVAPPSTLAAEEPLGASVQELGDLGELASAALLRTEVLAALDLGRQRAATGDRSGIAAPSTGSSTAADVAACAAVTATADPTLGALTGTGTATLEGEPVLVLVFEGGTSGVLVVVRADCTLVDRGAL